jgi:uncharacterized protein (TIGR00645 family)
VMTDITDAKAIPTLIHTIEKSPHAYGSPTGRYLAGIIFASRWLQAPLYLGLIVAQAIYVVIFVEELVHLVESLNKIQENDIMLVVLGLIDVVMISNLLIMVIIGGYETFVSRLRKEHHPDRPEWLSHVNANVLKIKLSMALIGISSIHLLESFINIENITTKDVMWRVIIHCVFIFSAAALAFTSKLSETAASEVMTEHS